MNNANSVMNDFSYLINAFLNFKNPSEELKNTFRYILVEYKTSIGE